MKLPDVPMRLRADPARLAQVVGNLLHNASKYTAHRGLVVICVQRREDESTISVRDSGIGIGAENLSRLFEMFRQIPGEPGRTASGLGIRLALVRTLVEMHGGSVLARSPGLGLGSEFAVRLPIDPGGMVAMTPQPAPEEATSAAPLRILVADDVADSARSLALALEIAGHEVHTAADGEAALRLANEFRPDPAILDIGMPVLDGYEVARRLRATVPGREMVLVALTGWGQREDVACALAAGFDRQMTKPADLGALQALIRSLPRRPRGQDDGGLPVTSA